MSENPINPSLHVDDEWKKQALREKEQLGGKPPVEAAPTVAPEAPKEKPPEPAKTARQLPPASFEFLVEQHVTQALIYMGLIPNPASGKAQLELDVARHVIDMLGMLQAKTKGNLTAEEENVLTRALYDLRMTFVKVQQKK